MSDERTPVVETAVKVRYAETDAQRVVYHGSYVVWFEVGRTEYCEKVGYPYPRMEAEGVFITVVEVKVRYRKSVRYGDVVRVRTSVSEVRSRGCSFRYEVVLPDGTLAAEGSTEHLFLDAAGRPRSTPIPIREAFAKFIAAN